jgi:hypothetical protein
MNQVFRTMRDIQATIKSGDTVPPGTFQYVPWTPELADGVST